MNTDASETLQASRYALIVVLAMLMACIAAGLLGSCAVLARDLVHPGGLFYLTCVAALAAFIAGCRYSLRSVSWIGEIGYVSTIVVAWLITRGTIVFACVRWPLVGDEHFLHRFVELLANGFDGKNLAGLSSQYDYSIWLSRAFPIYFPLRFLFHEGDIAAVRCANVLMGAATVVVVYVLAKHLIGGRYARCAAFLYFISPFHFFDAVSYTPQIPATLMITIAIWLIVRALDNRDFRPGQVLYTGVLVGVLLFAVRIQRGGFDQLILAGFPILLVLYVAGRQRTWRSLFPALATLGIAVLVWAPAAHVFDSWVLSHDTHHLSSHGLAFMVRGSNPVTLGEYLGRYQMLDAASAPDEKARVQWSVLATESAREPLLTLGALPFIKAVKLFSIGHAAAALTSSERVGDALVLQMIRAGTDVYAPFILGLCFLGLATATFHPLIGGRIVAISWFVLSAGLALMLSGEAALYSSHGFQPELAIIGALGVGFFRKGRRQTMLQVVRKVGLQVAVVMTGAVVMWVLVATGLFWLAVHAKSHLFRDMRGVEASINGQTVAVRPLNRWTTSWEQQIIVPQGTVLPAKLRVKWQGPLAPSVRMSIWTDSGADCACELVVGDRGHVSAYSNVELANMHRGDWAVTDSSAGAVVEIALMPRGAVGSLPLNQALAVDIGYAF